MHDEFEMSMMGELNFFLGLQIKQMEDGIFFNQSKYIKEMLKKFGLEDSKPMKTPMSSDTKLTKDEECESVDSTKYQGMIGQIFVEFVIHNQFFSYSLEDFAQILDIPCEGACAFTDRWSFDELAYGVPSDGPYQINPPYPDDIILSIRIDREGQVCRIRHEEEIDVQEYQVLTCEIEPTLKPFDEGQMFVEFVIQNQFFSYSLEDFAQILDILCEGACVFTDRWSLDELAYGAPSEGPYQKDHIKPTFLLPMISSRLFEKVKSLISVMRKKLRFKIIKFPLVKLCQHSNLWKK
ncbi:retrovirus-related pol polyprotein from transposon TNT 1-94 [Tanacetum coccineum]